MRPTSSSGLVGDWGGAEWGDWDSGRCFFGGGRSVGRLGGGGSDGETVDESTRVPPCQTGFRSLCGRLSESIR